VAWQSDYAAEFGSAPQPFSDLNFNAATLLLDRLRHVPTREAPDLVIRRTARLNVPAALAGCSCG
jgi:hypothetical protein